MTDEQFMRGLRSFSRRRPFRHFLIEFLSGERAEVKHPEGVAPFADVWLFTDTDGRRVIFTTSAVCRFLDK